MKALLLLPALFAAAVAPPAMAQSASAGTVRAIFRQTDVNNDGQVSRVEFEAGREVLFRRADANHDGRLTIPELRAMRPAGAPAPERRPSRQQINKLRAIDRNNDRAVDLNEFRAVGGQRFAAADQNRDGFIQPAEVADLARAMGAGD